MSFIEGINMSKLLFNEHLLQFNTSHSCFPLYLCLISQLIYRMHTLHKDKYTYRDSKLNNIIIDKDLKCPIIDFGFVKRIEDISNPRTFTICGTHHMKAPELYGNAIEKG